MNLSNQDNITNNNINPFNEENNSGFIFLEQFDKPIYESFNNINDYIKDNQIINNRIKDSEYINEQFSLDDMNAKMEERINAANKLKSNMSTIDMSKIDNSIPDVNVKIPTEDGVTQITNDNVDIKTNNTKINPTIKNNLMQSKINDKTVEGEVISKQNKSNSINISIPKNNNKNTNDNINNNKFESTCDVKQDFSCDKLIQMMSEKQCKCENDSNTKNISSNQSTSSTEKINDSENNSNAGGGCIIL